MRLGVGHVPFVFSEISTSNRWDNIMCRESENRVDAVI